MRPRLNPFRREEEWAPGEGGGEEGEEVARTPVFVAQARGGEGGGVRGASPEEEVVCSRRIAARLKDSQQI